LYLQGVTENSVHSGFWSEVCSHFLWQHEDKSGESKKKLVNFQQFDGVISACSAFVSRLVKSKSAELLVDLPLAYTSWWWWYWFGKLQAHISTHPTK
jgi:hypothetical protein